jgi:hypothetical protein
MGFYRGLSLDGSFRSPEGRHSVRVPLEGVHGIVDRPTRRGQVRVGKRPGLLCRSGRRCHGGTSATTPQETIKVRLTQRLFLPNGRPRQVQELSFQMASRPSSQTVALLVYTRV